MKPGMYLHMGYTYHMEIARKKGVLRLNLKRLTLGEWLVFVVCLRAWKLCGDTAALDEICGLVVTSNNRLTPDEKAAVVAYVEEITTDKKKDRTEGKKDKQKTKPDESWVSDVIAFFACRCGWTKSDVLDLYYDEIQPLMAAVNMIVTRDEEQEQDRQYIATAYAFGGGKGAYQKNVVDKRHRVPTQEAREKAEKLRDIEEAFLAPVIK